MSSLAARKKARATRKAGLRKTVEKQSSNTNFDNPNVWRCERDKSGKGHAVIRFLEPTDAMIDWYKETYNLTDEDSVPFYVEYHKHNFKGPNGKWYIEKCPTSKPGDAQECPVCIANGELVESAGGWKSMDDSHPSKKLVRNRKRKEIYVANVLIISDPANPENEGKVKIFEFGKSICGMILSQLIPEFEDEDDCDVADMWEGRDFNLKIIKKDGYANYEKSTWGDIGPVGSDDEIEKLLDKCHDLPAVVAPSEYKSFEDLEKGFARTQGKATSRRSVDDSGDDSGAPSDQETVDAKDAQASGKATGRRRSSARAAEPEKSKPSNDVDGGNDDDDFFNTLLDED